MLRGPKIMDKTAVRNRIVEIGIVPVVRATSSADAAMAAEAVAAGGIPIVEITMTVPGAIAVIGDLLRQFGDDVLVGAGTVIDAESARRCLDAGAQFLVSPGFDAATVTVATESATVIMAGALTPTEVITAWKTGADFVKVFPCANVGGARYIKALRGPLPKIPLVPTGGVNLETAADFLRAGATALGVGGELILADALQAQQPRRITDLARRYIEVVEETRAELSGMARASATPA